MAGQQGHFWSRAFDPAQADGGTQPSSCWTGGVALEHQIVGGHQSTPIVKNKQGEMLTDQLFPVNNSFTYLSSEPAGWGRPANSPGTEACKQEWGSPHHLQLCRKQQLPTAYYQAITVFKNETSSPSLRCFLYCTVKYEICF